MHVCIVGAGAAGLSAARRLTQLRPDCCITIIEARSRPGGRTCTFDISTDLDFPCDQVYVELGGEFIHGGNTSTAVLAAELGLTMVPVDRYGDMKYNTATSHFSDSVNVVELEEAFDKLINAPVDKKDYLCSLQDALLHFRPAMTPQDMVTADVLFAQTWCADIHHLSLGDLRDEAAVDVAGSDEYRLLEGYNELWRRIIATFPPTVSMRYNTTVTGIQHCDNVTITLSDFTSIICDAAIVTIPSTLLSFLSYTPPLPTTLQRALTILRTAPATKVILLFRDNAALRPLVNMTYLLSDDVSMHIPRWWTPRHGMTAPVAVIDTIMTDLIVVCGYVTDARAAKYDSLSEDDAQTAAVADICKILSLSHEDVVSHVLHFRRISWAADSHACGGYASIPPLPSAVENMSPRRDLAQPVYDRRVWFAGEACAHFSNRQTVHGAFDSGQRASEELVQRFA